MATAAQAGRVEAARRPKIMERPASSSRFDALVAGLATVFLFGIFLDGWAHNTYRDLIETFFTPSTPIGFAGIINARGLEATSALSRHSPNRGCSPQFGRRSAYETACEKAKLISNTGQNNGTVSPDAFVFIERLGAVADRRSDLRHRSGSDRRRDPERQGHVERLKNRHHQGSYLDRSRNLPVSGFGQWFIRSHRDGGRISNGDYLQRLRFDQPDDGRAGQHAGRRRGANHHGGRRRCAGLGNFLPTGGEHTDYTNSHPIARRQSQQRARAG